MKVEPDNQYTLVRKESEVDHKTNGWNEWAHRVLGDIERIEKQQENIFKLIGQVKDDISKDIKDISVEIAVLKTKAAFIGGVWGAVSGIFFAIVTAVILKAMGVK
jgi:hypothetical protein